MIVDGRHGKGVSLGKTTGSNQSGDHDEESFSPCFFCFPEGFDESCFVTVEVGTFARVNACVHTHGVEIPRGRRSMRLRRGAMPGGGEGGAFRERDSRSCLCCVFF